MKWLCLIAARTMMEGLLERVINSSSGKWLEKVMNSTEQKFGVTVTRAEDII